MVFAELENGASFSMTLTEIGSERLGVRDCVELRAGNVTIRTVDSTNYEAESTSRILRRARVNPSKAYEHMYQNISHTIVTRRPGDPITSLRSTELTLILEDELAGLPSSSIKQNLKSVKHFMFSCPALGIDFDTAGK